MDATKACMAAGIALSISFTGCMTETGGGQAADGGAGGHIQDARELGIIPLPEGGEWKSGFWKEREINYYRLNGINYFEGDMVIPDDEIQPTLALSKATSTGRTNGYWPNAEIPYVIDASASAFTANINAAIEHWKGRTPIFFLPRTTQGNYVRFRGADENTSNVGMIGGEQIINLVTNSMGVIAHEMGHAIGLWHEQSRQDRNNFIEINWANIRDEMEHNFHTEAGFSLDALDYNSIMMYPSFISNTAFVFDPNVWVMRRVSDRSTWTANRTALSTGDIRGAGRMYPGTAPIYRATNNDLIGQVIYGLLPGVARFQTDGNRILALTTAGELWGKDGIHGTWVGLRTGVQKFWFSGDNIAALATDGALWGKVGLNGTWRYLQGSVKDVRVEGSRYVALTTDNTLSGKDGISGAWVHLRPGVSEFKLAGNRIVALGSDGVLWGKDGLNGIWHNLRGSVRAFAVSGNRIAAIETGNVLWGKEGLSGTWLNLISGVSSVQLEGNRIGALLTDGTLMAKDGLSGTWVNELPGVSDFYLSGNAITVRNANTMYSKTGLNGIWHFYASNCAQFEQI